MRKFIILLVAAILMTGFTSCKKDKDGDLPNTLTIGTKTYKIGAACCYSYEIQNINKYNLFLTNKITWNYNGDMTTNSSTYVNGYEINLHYLYANGSSLNELPSGRYKYGDEYESFTHSGDSDYMFYDANGKPGRWIDMGQSYAKNSKLVIDVKHINDNIYEIKFSGAVDYDGKTVNGHYKGEVYFYRPR
jgi:hypothetical protein